MVQFRREAIANTKTMANDEFSDCNVGTSRDSEVSVVSTFVARRTSLQKHLDASYHGDRYFRARLLNAVDIPNI